jgi:hypothetical protein
MMHLSEEELIAQAYGEGDKAAVEQHIEQCAPCARAYTDLRSDLAEMRFPDPPARDDAYGERVWHSLSGSLHPYKQQKRAWAGLWRGLSYAAACALLMVCAFIGGRLWERRQVQNAANNSQQKQQLPVHPQQRPHIVVVVLSDHLDRSERLLVELKHADAQNAEMISPLRDEARTLLTANRICLKNSKQDDDPALATALNRLDHLFGELADQPGTPSAATLTQLQKEMNADGILFEVRVLRSRIPDRDKTLAAQSKGSTI